MRRHYTAEMIGEGLDKKAAREEGERKAKGFTGHSGRVGVVVTAKEKGVADTSIMSLTRHKSTSMIAHYGKKEAKGLLSPLNTEGVGL